MCWTTFTDSLEKKPTSFVISPDASSRLQVSCSMSVTVCIWFSNIGQTWRSNCTLFIRMHICREQKTEVIYLHMKLVHVYKFTSNISLCLYLETLQQHRCSVHWGCSATYLSSTRHMIFAYRNLLVNTSVAFTCTSTASVTHVTFHTYK